jgi:hypothetical protein
MEVVTTIRELEDDYLPIDGNTRHYGDFYVNFRKSVLEDRAKAGYFITDVFNNISFYVVG